METKKYVAYYRVSTAKQGRSGLGLEAQRESVGVYTGGRIEREYVEVESGKKSDRPQLQEALDYCQKYGCALVVARLDRLARSVSFIFALRDSGVDFICADMPDLNTLTLGIFASVAQYEAELISKRTKEALAVKKTQGYKLGTPENLTTAAREKGRAAMHDKAISSPDNRKAYTLTKTLREKGLGLAKIADSLNNAGLKSPRGGKWYPTSIKNLINLFTDNN